MTWVYFILIKYRIKLSKNVLNYYFDFSFLIKTIDFVLLSRWVNVLNEYLRFGLNGLHFFHIHFSFDLFESAVFPLLAYNFVVMTAIQHISFIILRLQSCSTTEHSKLSATPVNHVRPRYMPIECMLMIHQLLTSIPSYPQFSTCKFEHKVWRKQQNSINIVKSFKQGENFLKNNRLQQHLWPNG